MASANRFTEQALTADVLRGSLNYDPETGIFTRLATKTFNPRIQVGQQAGYLMQSGYRIIKIGKLRFLAHRLAWFYVYGEWPVEEIDHINRERDDNRIANLRAASRQQNTWNLSASSRSKTGHLNISPSFGKFEVGICRSGTVFRKRFDSIANAIAARDAFRQSLDGGR